jgi:hypothetical protein
MLFLFRLCKCQRSDACISAPTAQKTNAKDEKCRTNLATAIPPPPQKKKKQLSGYNIFVSSEIKEKKSEQSCSKETFNDLMKSVSSRWKTLSSEEKAKWNLEGQ